MMSGANVYEVANTIQGALDVIKANPTKYLGQAPSARPQVYDTTRMLPEDYRRSLDEAFGDCGEAGDLDRRGPQ